MTLLKQDFVRGTLFGIAMCLAGVWIMEHPAFAQLGSEDTIRAHKFQLIDSANRVLAEIKPTKEGKGSIQLMSPEGVVLWVAPGPRVIPASR